MMAGVHLGHVAAVIGCYIGHTIRKLTMASMHWELSSNRRLLRWENALSTINVLNRAAYMWPLSMKAHMPRSCICAFSRCEGVKVVVNPINEI